MGIAHREHSGASKGNRVLGTLAFMKEHVLYVCTILYIVQVKQTKYLRQKKIGRQPYKEYTF